MVRSLLFVLALLGAGAAYAQTAGECLAAGQKVNARIFSAGHDPYPDHRVTFAGGVTGFPDMTYSIVPRYRPMKLDLYLPPASFAGPRPTVVFIHGGGSAGDGPRLSAAFDNWPSVLASITASSAKHRKRPAARPSARWRERSTSSTR